MKELIKGKKGFTLIELVIVIAILGILAGIAIPRFLDATATARGSRIVADLRTIDSAIVIYNAKTGELPSSAAKLTTVSAGTGTGTLAAGYQLLAAWPTPVTGNCIFPGHPADTVVNSATAYTLDTTNGRALIGSYNASDLTSTTSTISAISGS